MEYVSHGVSYKGVSYKRKILIIEEGKREEEGGLWKETRFFGFLLFYDIS